MEKNEMLEALKSYTPAQLLESAPDLYNKIISASVNDKEVQEALKNLPTVTKDRDELLDKNKTLTTDNEKLVADLKESQDKVKVFEDKEEAGKWATTVDEFIKESKIDNALVTETFKGQLIESKDPEKVKTLLDDRKGLKTEPDFDNGKPKGDNTQEGEKTEMPTDDELARSIKSN